MKTQSPKRIVWAIPIALGVALLLGLFGGILPYMKIDQWICSVSGSTKTQVTWFGGYFSQEQRATSPLEQWLKRREPAFQPNWVHTSTTTYYVLGRRYACGKTPEIYRLNSILNGVVSKFKEERIAGLVQVLRQGSRDEQREAVQKIADDYFNGK